MIAIDGDVSDWSAIKGATVKLEQIRLGNLPPSQAAEIKFGPLDPIDVTFKVANDGKNIYVLPRREPPRLGRLSSGLLLGVRAPSSNDLERPISPRPEPEYREVLVQ